MYPLLLPVCNDYTYNNIIDCDWIAQRLKISGAGGGQQKHHGQEPDRQ